MTGAKNGFAHGKTLNLALAAGLLLATGAMAHEEKKSTPPQAARASQNGAMMAAKTMTVPGTEPGTIPGVQNLGIPDMDPALGRKLFAAKGCVACHSINGVGGRHARALDASTMQTMTHPFEFAAKMWAAAPHMIAAQEEALGAQILFTGEELAHISAFAHSHAEQRKFSKADIPPEVLPMMHHGHGAPGGGAKQHAEESDHAQGQEHHEN